MNRLNARTRALILHALLEGMSQRSCERIFGVSQNTVVKLFEEAGDMAISHLAALNDLTIARTQADELHAFVAARSFNVEGMKIPNDEAGTIWTYLAVCAKTKLIYAYHLGAQGLDDATTFMRCVASKLKRNPGGGFTVRPTIVTDGLRAYPEAIERAFGSDVNYGVLQKSYSKTDPDGNRLSGSRYEGALRIVVKGEIDERDIHTSYVERQNLNVRMAVRRYGRRTNAFSKKLANHERHVALWIVYHNYCWIPRPRRPRDGSRSWTKRVTAAMEAGVDDELWGIDHLIGMTDAFTQDRRMSADDGTGKTGADSESVVVDAADVELAPSHWVYRSRLHHTTKVHTAGCSNCRDGMGKKGTGGTPAGEWLPFYRLEDATAAAEALEPDSTSICSMCLGEYRKLGGGR